MKFSKKIIISATAFIVILLITNPSYYKFNNFTKEIPVRGIYTNTKQTFNGFVFSIYSKEIIYTYSGVYYDKRNETIGSITTIKYLGILSNFFRISEEAKKATGKIK